MEQWLEYTNGNPFPNISRLIKRYNNFLVWLQEWDRDSPIPVEFQGFYDDMSLEFARVLNHDLNKLSSKVAKYMLLMNDEYEIKVKVE
jgi:hypothetical protein